MLTFKYVCLQPVWAHLPLLHAIQLQKDILPFPAALSMEWNIVTTGDQIGQSFFNQSATFFDTITKPAFGLPKEHAYSATHKLHPATVLMTLLAICFNTDLLGINRHWNFQCHFHYHCLEKQVYLKLPGVKEAHGTTGAQSVTLRSANSNTVLSRKSIRPLIGWHLCSTKSVIPL